MSQSTVEFGKTEVVEFELGEDVRDESRLRQDREWAGAVADGRGHVSHREMAMLNAPQLCLAISDYLLIEELVTALDSKTSILNKITPETLRLIIEYAFPGHETLVTTSVIRRKFGPLIDAERAYSNLGNEFPFRICLRKRPMMPYEHDFGAYDVCSIDTRNGLTLHEGKLARNGRQLSMTHHQFLVDRVYEEEASNATVCLDAVEPLVSWAESGHSSTLLCFGQTGTGKTYTLYGALEYLSTRLVGKYIRITFYEVHGKKCYDLLSNRNLVHLRSDAEENMHVRGARSIDLCPLSDPSALVEVLREALSLRSSKVTERNPISSRSHAVCTIELLDADLPAPPTSAAPDRSLGAYLASQAGTGVPQTPTRAVIGKITLVDLAGSERNYETTQMTAAQHKESADINFALMTLKDCFRMYHAHLTGHLASLQERVQQKLDAGQPDALKPNLFNSSTNTDNIVKTIHNVGAGLISGTKATLQPAGGLVDLSLADENVAPKEDAPSAVEAQLPTPQQTSVRIPFRASPLTKVLKECFTSGASHRTTIIATLSPTPIDLQHSLNTLNHVVLMCPELQQLTHRLTVEVPLNLHLQMQNRFNAQAAHSTAVGSGLSTKHVADWTPEEVIAWLATAERGRFKHVVLPPGIDGRGVLMLSETNMVDLFAAQDQNTARGLKEGAAWVETAGDDLRKVRRLGRALWSALRREMQSSRARESQLAQLKK